MHAIAYMQPLGQSVSWIPTVLLPLAPSFGPSVFHVLHYQIISTPNQARLKLPTGLGTPQVVPCNRIRKRKRVCQIISTRFEPKCQRNPSLPQCSQMLTANGAHEGVLKLWMSNTNTRDVLSSIIHSRVTAIPPESRTSDSIHFWILTEGHPEAAPKLITARGLCKHLAWKNVPAPNCLTNAMHNWLREMMRKRVRVWVFIRKPRKILPKSKPGRGTGNIRTDQN
jgi:hypothetical protein